MDSPVQVTFRCEPVTVYPVLQVQTTPLDFPSWEHNAFGSQPPFFTSQASSREERSYSKKNQPHASTGANDIGGGPRIGVSCLASAHHGIGLQIMGTYGIRMAAAVVDLTGI